MCEVFVEKRLMFFYMTLSLFNKSALRIIIKIEEIMAQLIIHHKIPTESTSYKLNWLLILHYRHFPCDYRALLIIIPNSSPTNIYTKTGILRLPTSEEKQLFVSQREVVVKFCKITSIHSTRVSNAARFVF